MNLFSARISACLAALCLLGCSHLPQAPQADWTAALATQPQATSLQGQLSIKLQAFQDQEAKGISLGFFFTGTQQLGQLDLMTPLGSQMAQVRWTQTDAWLQTEQGQRHFDTLDQLSQETLGEPIPLSALMYWIKGEAAPHLAAPTETQSQSFEQAGWIITTTDVAQGSVSARRPASAQQRGIALKVRLDR